jgi:hypothetical protein
MFDPKGTHQLTGLLQTLFKFIKPLFACFVCGTASSSSGIQEW